jgi:hypothetical protein
MYWLHAQLSSTHGIDELWAAVDPRNARSIALLRRLNYETAEPDATRPLQSYEPNDVCFRRRNS